MDPEIVINIKYFLFFRNQQLNNSYKIFLQRRKLTKQNITRYIFISLVSAPVYTDESLRCCNRILLSYKCINLFLDHSKPSKISLEVQVKCLKYGFKETFLLLLLLNVYHLCKLMLSFIL